MFARAGLNVELVRLAGAAAIAAAIAGGSLEIGKGATMSVITAIAKGLPFTIIGNISEYRQAHPDIALIALKDSPIKTAKDLIGKMLADVSLNDQNSVATFAWLDQHGVDWKTLKYVEIPASASLAAMEAGRIVGSTVYEPVFTADMNTGKVRVIGYPYDAIGSSFSDAVLFANPCWWDADHKATQNFFASSGGERVRRAPRKRSGADQRRVRRRRSEADHRHPAHRARRRITPALIQPMINTAVKYKAIPKAIPAKELI